MNKVILIGRLTKDPAMSVIPSSQLSVARFSLAIDRGKDKEGNDRGADFPGIVCFGRTAELCEKYLSKGKQIAIEGKIQTGSYEKDGKKIYTTDILAEKIEFVGNKSDNGKPEPQVEEPKGIPGPVEGFTQISDEDIPF